MCQPQPRVGSGRARAKERPTPRRGPKSALQSPGEPLPQPLPPQHRQHRHPAAGQGRCCDGAVADRQTHAAPESSYENGLRIDVEICPKQQDTAFNLLIKTLEFSPPQRTRAAAREPVLGAQHLLQPQQPQGDSTEMGAWHRPPEGTREWEVPAGGTGALSPSTAVSEAAAACRASSKSCPGLLVGNLL